MIIPLDKGINNLQVYLIFLMGKAYSPLDSNQ